MCKVGGFLMINSVSSVSFRANAPADIISRPGTYAIVDADPKAAKKEKHSNLKGAALALGSAVLISGALIYGSKGGKWFKPIEGELKDAKLMDKISHYLNKAGSKLDEKVWTPIVNLFKKGKGEEAAEKAATKVETVA